ncbi:hypothetical protein B0J14DRAFT_471131, partial [Halenospora varia]
PFKCTTSSCRGLGFRYRKDLTRHLEEVHGTRRFYCPVETCKHSEANRKGLARLNNINRHVRKAHPAICETDS